MAKTVSSAPRRTSTTEKREARPDASRDGMAQMVVFTFADGRTLEIHVPGATGFEGGRSVAKTAGFILRRGREIVNVGALEDLLQE